MKLPDNFRDPSRRVSKAITFIDIVDSTGMKEREPEAAWLTTFAYIYEVIRDVIDVGDGTITKFLGDGAMIEYDDDHATSAINDAILIQEAIKEDVERKQVTVKCAIGIAIGDVVQFEMNDGMDYLGTTVDRAARLCSIASAGSIFVDTATTASAQMNRIRSTIGTALGRKTDEYQGPVERANLPGFVAPVEYHEIKWDQQLFGVKSKVVSAAVESRAASTPTPTPPAAAPTVIRASGPSTRKGIRGTVQRWDSEKGRGWIVGPDNEEFYCDSRFTVSQDGVQRDDIVYFCPVEPNAAGKNRVATAVVYMGQEAVGMVVGVREEGYGFLQVLDQRNNAQDIFFSLDEAPAGVQRGDQVTCVIVEAARGVRAEGLERRDSEAMAA